MDDVIDRLRPHGVSREVADLQATRYRAMSAEEKLRIADDLGRMAWELTCAGVRMRRPDYDDLRVRAEAKAIIRAAAD